MSPAQPEVNNIVIVYQLVNLKQSEGKKKKNCPCLHRNSFPASCFTFLDKRSHTIHCLAVYHKRIKNKPNHHHQQNQTLY